jgi:hypothetical protein
MQSSIAQATASKTIRATNAKEVGVMDPAEETFRRLDQMQ